MNSHNEMLKAKKFENDLGWASFPLLTISAATSCYIDSKMVWAYTGL